jgi:hypothetical protein
MDNRGSPGEESNSEVGKDEIVVVHLWIFQATATNTY